MTAGSCLSFPTKMSAASAEPAPILVPMPGGAFPCTLSKKLSLSSILSLPQGLLLPLCLQPRAMLTSAFRGRPRSLVPNLSSKGWRRPHLTKADQRCRGERSTAQRVTGVGEALTQSQVPLLSPTRNVASTFPHEHLKVRNPCCKSTWLFLGPPAERLRPSQGPGAVFP